MQIPIINGDIGKQQKKNLFYSDIKNGLSHLGSVLRMVSELAFRTSKTPICYYTVLWCPLKELSSDDNYLLSSSPEAVRNKVYH